MKLASITDPKRVDVEQVLGDCVERIGGVVFDRNHSGPDLRPNADYIFPAHDVIAELKCLQKDVFTDRGLSDRLTPLYARWVRTKLVSPPKSGTFKISTKDLPARCQEDIAQVLGRPIKAAVRKANQQIESTKEDQEMPDAQGLLLLINDGSSLSPELFCALINRVFRQRYHSINSIIYLSANEALYVPGMHGICLPWIHYLLPGRTPVDGSLLELLQQAWYNRLAAHRLDVIPVVRLIGGQPSILKGMCFAKPHQSTQISSSLL